MTSGVLKMLECRANISPALIAAPDSAAAGNQTTDRLGDVNKAAPDAEMIHFGDSFDIASGFDAKVDDRLWPRLCKNSTTFSPQKSPSNTT